MRARWRSPTARRSPPRSSSACSRTTPAWASSGTWMPATTARSRSPKSAVFVCQCARLSDMSFADALLVDPLWPRAGDWPAPSGSAPYGRVDVALIGVPTHATSISTTNAHETPDAVRAMLPRYSEFTHSEFTHSTVGSEAARVLTFADYGNIVDPDGDEQA